MLVPFLAFDPESMHRLGYGGGYYDRTLQKLRSEEGSKVVAIGVGLECQKYSSSDND